MLELERIAEEKVIELDTISIEYLGNYEIGEFVRYVSGYHLPLRRDMEGAFTLDKAIKILKSGGYRVASAEEIAQARIEGGINSKMMCGGLTKEAIIGFPKEGRLIMTKDSPLLDNIEMIHQWKEDHFSPHGHLYKDTEGDKYLKNAIQVNIKKLIPESSGDFKIPTEIFGEEEITYFLYGKTAKEYGKFLLRNGFEYAKIREDIMLHLEDINLPATVAQCSLSAFRNKAAIRAGCFYHDPIMFFIK